MARVLVERARGGPRVRLKRRKRHQGLERNPEASPEREPMSRGRGTKWLNEHLGPLERYLRSQVGRPWDKVYSEISERLRPTNAVQQHVRDHLADFVITETWVEDGEPMGRGPRQTPIALKAPHHRAQFYVDPRCGLLRECKQKREHGRETPVLDVRWDGPWRQLRCIDAVWYALRLEPIPHDPSLHASVRDLLLRRACRSCSRATSEDYDCATRTDGWMCLPRRSNSSASASCGASRVCPRVGVAMSREKEKSYQELLPTGGVPVRAWTRGVHFDGAAQRQLANVARLPILHSHVAAMPDVHVGIGATVGSVIPTVGAIIPAAVGVDIGCGMVAQRTSLRAEQLPDALATLRSEIEQAVPHGGGEGHRTGAWTEAPAHVCRAWRSLADRYARILARHPKVEHRRALEQLGTLGGGNHFIEVCLDEEDRVWVMLHSGSRGAGNRIGTHFIHLAQREAQREQLRLPDRGLAYLREGSELFADYVAAVGWAQDYARASRELMLAAVLAVLRAQLPPFGVEERAIDCHHNYVAREHHFGADVYVTRKGALRARKDDLGIIPGSMGARSFIVRGEGNPESFESCSHGAGRAMSRGDARRRFSLEDHRRATRDVECRKDRAVLDETPKAYKPIDAVMRAQEDLVSIVHELRQVVCVKG